VIVGVRPGDFEDARLVDERRHGAGHIFEATIDLVESMGSEIYAYFSHEGEAASAEQLGELQADAGAGEVPDTAGRQVIARLAASSDVERGRRATLWLDSARLHLFDPRTGRNLTRATA
jgi:multiple sugar transport system ATP-binding protein